MRESKGIDGLLQSARGLGELDSSGSFTIAGEAAIGKLAAFQLPRKTAWLLKIVQAAVVSGAPEIRIFQTNETTSFRFSPPDELCMETLKKALLSPQVQGSDIYRHLAVGLRAVGFGDRRQFTLAYDFSDTRTLFGWNGKELSQRAEANPDGPGPALHIGVAFPPEDMGRSLGGLKKSAGRATQEYEEVVRNGEACPIPLYFDGRRLDGLSAPLSDDTKANVSLLSVGWAPYSENSRFPPLQVPSALQTYDENWRPTDKFTDNRIFLFSGDLAHTQASSLAKLHYSYRIVHHRSKYKSFKFESVRRESEYLWVKDGVICQRDRSWQKQSPISFQLFLSADDLDTDISGLMLRNVDQLERRKNLAREQLQFQVENTLAAIEKHIPKPFGFHSAIYGTMGVVFTMLGPVTMGKGFIGTAMIVGLALSAYDKRQILEDCRYHLRRFGDQVRFPERTP